MNINKDRRVKITAELIDAIKHVKIYGWEMAFRRIICMVREKEVASLMKLNIGRSFELAIATFSTNLGAFISLYVRSLSAELTDAVIFTTLELVGFIKMSNMFLSLGFGLIIEFNVIF